MVHLVGGGPSALMQTRRHFKAAIAALHKKKPLVAYVGAASKDSVPFRKMISMALSGARVEPANLASARAKVSAARQLHGSARLVTDPQACQCRAAALVTRRCSQLGGAARVRLSGVREPQLEALAETAPSVQTVSPVPLPPLAPQGDSQQAG